ncbi:MAG: GNAT family N-acetyltransferase [Bryobacteraceae bacterium]
MAAELLESDARYFELGARIEPSSGFDLVWVPGFTHLSAGCVVQRATATEPPSTWLRNAEADFARVGARWNRIYLTSPAPGLEVLLAARGYRCRREIGFLSPSGTAPAEPETTWRPVLDAEDWQIPARMRQQGGLNSDGYRTSPQEWMALMRLKHQTGEQEPFLLMRGNAVCGEVSVMDRPGMLRLKNLFVAPEWRGKGVGVDAAHLVWREAIRRGKAAAGVFGLEGEPGSSVYSRAGFIATTDQVEWSVER